MNKLDTSESLLSKNESTFIKGILIILVVIGHNGILMGKAPGLEVVPFNRYLYTFHVYSFLILPFLYNIPFFSIERIKKNFIRLYKPYTFAFILLAIFFYISNHTLSFDKCIIAYIFGSEKLLRNSIGASFVWFIPSMFSLLILRDYFFHTSQKIIWITLLSFLFYCVFYIGSFFSVYDTAKYFPFGLLPAISLVSIGFLARLICCYMNNNKRKLFFFLLLGMFITYIFFIIDNSNINVSYKKIYNGSIMTLFMFVFIVAVAKIFSERKYVNIIKYLGKHSLEIYITHVFIYNILLNVILKLNIELNITTGLITLLITVLCSVGIIEIGKNIRFYNFLFSK